jgi:hypothetical protein
MAQVDPLRTFVCVGRNASPCPLRSLPKAARGISRWGGKRKLGRSEVTNSTALFAHLTRSEGSQTSRMISIR